MKRLFQHARAAWRRLGGGELTPARAAGSVAVGLAIGVTPLWGLHMLLVLAVCVPLRLDARLSYLAANVSLPFFAPFITLAEIQLGARLLHGAWLTVDAETARTHGAGRFASELLVGTAALSLGGGLLGGAVTYAAAAAVRAWRRPPDPFSRRIDEVAARYAPFRRAAYYYVRGKLAGDPVARALLSLGGDQGLGAVVDAGCGRGQMAALLLVAGRATGVHGVDWDADKVADARRACRGLAAEFHAGDLREVELPPCDTLLLIDVIHYLTEDEQDAVVKRAAAVAARRVVIRELDPDRGWRSAVTRLQEAITTGLRYNVGARVRPRAIAATTRVLERAGYEVTVEPCWGGTPFSNVLVVASRKATSLANTSPK